MLIFRSEQIFLYQISKARYAQKHSLKKTFGKNYLDKYWK